jgi:hypothetical protein
MEECGKNEREEGDEDEDGEPGDETDSGWPLAIGLGCSTASRGTTGVSTRGKRVRYPDGMTTT